MALAPTVDAHGFTRCDRCGTRFKVHHVCRFRRADGPALRRPPNFAELVAQGRAEARAAAIEQPTLLELAPPCDRCGGLDSDLDPETGICISCIAAAALEAAGVGQEVDELLVTIRPDRSP